MMVCCVGLGGDLQIFSKKQIGQVCPVDSSLNPLLPMKPSYELHMAPIKGLPTSSEDTCEFPFIVGFDKTEIS